MAGVEGEDEYRDALGAADPPPSATSPTSKPRPAAAAGDGGGGLGRRLLASIPLPVSLSAAIGRFSSPKTPTSNAGLGLGLLLHEGPACSADATPASDAVSAGSSLHLLPVPALQRQHGEDQVAARDAVVEEEGLGLVLAEKERPAAEGRDDEAVAVDVCSANRNCFPLRGQEEEGQQYPGDELGAAVDDSMAQCQEEEEVVVEQEGATLDCAAVVEDQSNNFGVEQCAGHETSAVKDGDTLEVNESVMEQEGAVGILDVAEDSVTVELQEEDLIVAEQGEDGISVQDQHELREQCTGDQLSPITDGNAVQNQEVVELEGAADCYSPLEVVEKCTNNGSKSVKDGNIVEDEEQAVQQECGVGVLDAAKDGAPVELQEEGVLVPEQNEDGISVQDYHKVVEQCIGDQLRTARYDNAAQDQEVVELEGATEYYTSVEAVEQCTIDGSRSFKYGSVVEENGKEVEHKVAVGVLDAAKDCVIVESQDEDLVVAEQGEDDIFVQDQHKVMEQCTCGQLGTTMDDNAAETQEAVEQYCAIVDRDATTDAIAVEDQDTELKQPAVHESRATEDENAVEFDKKVVDQEDVVEIHRVIKDGSAVEVLEENDVVDIEQGGDVIFLHDEGNLAEKYYSDQLEATMEDTAAENQEVVEQEGAIVERVVTSDGISIKDQEAEVEHFAGDKSRATKDDVVEDNEKAYQEDVIDKQGIIKDGSGEESLEEGDMVFAEQGGHEFSVRDLGSVVEQCTSIQLRTIMEDNATQCQAVVVQEGAIFERGVADGINVEDQGKEVEQSADDESRATKDKNAVEDNKEEVDQEDAIDKHGTAMDGNGVESQEEENMVVTDQDVDGICVLDEGTAKLVVQCTSDQLRIITDDNAAEDPEVAEQKSVVSILGADKVNIAVESWEVDIVGAVQVEDGVSVQDQDKGVEQCTSDELRTTINVNDNAVKDQEVHRENISLSAGYPQRPGKLNCRFYMSTGRCSYGSSCHFNHPRMKPKLEVSSFPSEQRDHEVEFLELNRVGLPIREGARKCTYYMRYGICRYGKKCCYNHPEEVLDTQLYTPTGWDDTNLQSSPHSKKSPEHATIDDKSSGSEILPPNILRMLLPPQNVPPFTEEKETKLKKDPDWSSASNDSDGCCSADSSDGPLCKQEHVDYPERPECPFLLKFGNCKFATSCQYYHPKEKIPSRYHPKKDSILAEELTVYPDRPGKPECPFYVKTGSCKFGKNCKFHHPKDLTPSMQDSASPKRPVAANEYHQAAGATLHHHMNQQHKYPERPGQPDCRYYMQFGKCKFQSACIFNHPKDILSSERHPAECPFYMKNGTCHFGSACEFYHPKDNCPSRGRAMDNGTDCEHDFVTKSEIVLQQQEQTIYPERPCEPECPHYMKHGYCKFQMKCKFHHPADRVFQQNRTISVQPL